MLRVLVIIAMLGGIARAEPVRSAAPAGETHLDNPSVPPPPSPAATTAVACNSARSAASPSCS